MADTRDIIKELRRAADELERTLEIEEAEQQGPPWAIAHLFGYLHASWEDGEITKLAWTPVDAVEGLGVFIEASLNCPLGEWDVSHVDGALWAALRRYLENAEIVGGNALAITWEE